MNDDTTDISSRTKFFQCLKFIHSQICWYSTCLNESLRAYTNNRCLFWLFSLPGSSLFSIFDHLQSPKNIFTKLANNLSALLQLQGFKAQMFILFTILAFNSWYKLKHEILSSFLAPLLSFLTYQEWLSMPFECGVWWCRAQLGLVGLPLKSLRGTCMN